MNEHTCPACGYSADIDFHPHDYDICGCCGTEFGYDDRVLTHEQLRAEWIQKGCPWFDPNEQKPLGWNAYDQLQRAKLIPTLTLSTTTQTTIGRATLQGGGPVIRVRLSGNQPEFRLAV